MVIITPAKDCGIVQPVSVCLWTLPSLFIVSFGASFCAQKKNQLSPRFDKSSKISFVVSNNESTTLSLSTMSSCPTNLRKHTHTSAHPDLTSDQFDTNVTFKQVNKTAVDYTHALWTKTIVLSWQVSAERERERKSAPSSITLATAEVCMTEESSVCLRYWSRLVCSWRRRLRWSPIVPADDSRVATTITVTNFTRTERYNEIYIRTFINCIHRRKAFESCCGPALSGSQSVMFSSQKNATCWPNRFWDQLYWLETISIFC